MSGRPVKPPTDADLIAALRADGLLYAADRLTELDAECRELHDKLDEYAVELEAIDALRPPCPTCDGTQRIWIPIGARKNGMGAPCPDCVDGKVSIERLAATWRAVESEWVKLREVEASRHGLTALGRHALETVRHLRAVRP